ncbi:ParB/Srx family N-terminal domain-containing protein [Janthinobacterium sp. SUN100]|uniref:ParB/Srx family N-terminal domain-containing protein n=1 Tax=Janthinobacterium sp. SUN100 TaxID=3004101 RepID=UPI0025AF3056|nr:ParB/Srx family N-terminal domain-containing protein [Janthinobacterium sp. SUN100]MDN2702781.1 ParB/Srx family N-terminal domain-containing protein [Janthinobacterium sp. SUN100]
MNRILSRIPALLLALACIAAFLPPALARDAAVAPALSARQQALMATVTGSAAHPRILQVRLDELHPTQPAIGYDQVYYKLGRYATEEKHIADIAKPKKFADLCEANGQGDVLPGTANVAGATLATPPPGYRCKAAVGSRPDDMKTVVIGPRGTVYLTDGHHTFSTFWDADGGRNHQLKVWVKVSDNFSALGETAFWARMRAENKVWLKNGRNQAITPQQLPSAIGLASLGDDPYRSLVSLRARSATSRPARLRNFSNSTGPTGCAANRRWTWRVSTCLIPSRMPAPSCWRRRRWWRCNRRSSSAAASARRTLARCAKSTMQRSTN